MPPNARFRVFNSNLKVCEKELTKVVSVGVWVQPFGIIVMHWNVQNNTI